MAIRRGGNYNWGGASLATASNTLTATAAAPTVATSIQSAQVTQPSVADIFQASIDDLGGSEMFSYQPATVQPVQTVQPVVNNSVANASFADIVALNGTQTSSISLSSSQRRDDRAPFVPTTVNPGPTTVINGGNGQLVTQAGPLTGYAQGAINNPAPSQVQQASIFGGNSGLILLALAGLAFVLFTGKKKIKL